VRNESNASKDPKAPGPAKLQDDLCEALERLKLTRAGRSIAQHAFATSTDPAYIFARENGKQFALATNYINTHFVDDYNTPCGLLAHYSGSAEGRWKLQSRSDKRKGTQGKRQRWLQGMTEL
jgi:hypothetical protein